LVHQRKNLCNFIEPVVDPYTLFIDTQIKAQFLGRLKELPITPFIREERDLSHEKKTESDDIQTLIASSF